MFKSFPWSCHSRFKIWQTHIFRKGFSIDPIQSWSLYQPINAPAISVALIRNHCSEKQPRHFIHQYEIKQQPLRMGLLSWVHLYWNQFICNVHGNLALRLYAVNAWEVLVKKVLKDWCQRHSSPSLIPERERERYTKRKRQKESTNCEITADFVLRKSHLSQIKLSKWKEQCKSNSLA